MTAPQLESLSSIKVRREIFRKSLHLPGLLVPVAARYSLALTLSVLTALCLLYLLSESFRLKQKNTLPVFGPLGAALTRSTDLDWAPVMLAIGLGAAALLFPFRAAMAGTILVCVSDGMAAIVGMSWGERRWPWSNKTYLGSAMFLASALLFLPALISWKSTLLIALGATMIESLSAKGIDNLLLPIFGAWLAAYFL